VLDFGEINSGQQSGTKTINITNCGNVILDYNFSGEDYQCHENCGTINTIKVSNVTFSNVSTGPYINLTTQAQFMKFGTSVAYNDNMYYFVNTSYWKLFAPVGTKGKYNSTITITAIKSN